MVSRAVREPALCAWTVAGSSIEDSSNRPVTGDLETHMARPFCRQSSWGPVSAEATKPSRPVSGGSHGVLSSMEQGSDEDGRTFAPTQDGERP